MKCFLASLCTGPNWRQQSWHLVPVDAARSTSCLHELLHPTYVLIMAELYEDLHPRPHGLLEVVRQLEDPRVRNSEDPRVRVGQVPIGSSSEPGPNLRKLLRAQDR